jgi:hypothetical protein
MRVNVYAEEMTQRVIVKDETVDGRPFIGVRFYLELPASFIEGRPAKETDTLQATQMQAPFFHRLKDDDSSAVTFWAKDRENLRSLLVKALAALDKHPI